MATFEVQPPLALQAAGILHPALLVRRGFGSIVGEGVTNYNTSGDMKVSPTSPASIAVKVARGGVWITGDDETDQGSYFAYNSADSTVTLDTPDGTNDRVDIIIAHARDATEDVTMDNTWKLEAVAGIPSGSPAAPATPNSAYKLAEVTVRAGASSVVSGDITDKRSLMGLLASPTIPSARVSRQLSDQTITSGTDVTVSFDTMEFDFDADPFWSSGAPTKLTVPAGYKGIYIVRGSVGLNAGGTGTRRNAKIWVNGSAKEESQVSVDVAQGADTVLPVTGILSLKAGDDITVTAYHDGTTHKVLGGFFTNLSIVKVG